VAKESAYFLLAFVNIGLVPDGGGSLFVPGPRRVRPPRRRWRCSASRLPRPRAVDIGLINAAWPDADFEKKRRGPAAAPEQRARTRSYAGTKRELNHWAYSRMAEHLALEASIPGRARPEQGLRRRGRRVSSRSAPLTSPASDASE